MKPLSWDKQLGLALPLKHAASQSGQTNNPSEKDTGLDVSHHTRVSPEGRGKCFFLDILFHRMSVIAMFRQRPTSKEKVSFDQSRISSSISPRWNRLEAVVTLESPSKSFRLLGFALAISAVIAFPMEQVIHENYRR
jgi:hypothetical protein